MENTSFTVGDGSDKHPNKPEERENGKTPTEVGINIAGHMKAAKPPALAPYAGMNKEDLLRFSDTPFWNRLRMVCLVMFWLVWFGLIAAIVALTIVLPRCQEPPSQSWWQKSTFYQVYVRSFQDSDADGNGDLKGLESRLDYLESLSVDAVVMSSVLDSGGSGNLGVDAGYQVVNYTNIDVLFGDLQDMDDLISAAHEKGMKVVMDFVPNFTGLDHPWFAGSASATAPGDPYYTYYVWQDCGVNGTNPPNNWRSAYDQGAWNYHPIRDQCYLAQFLPGQPELNLESEDVQEELKEVLRFWLDRGVDGFRVNSVAYLFENHDLDNETFIDSADCVSGTDDELRYECYIHDKTRDQPEVHDVVQEWKAVISEYSIRTGQHRVLITDADTTLAETVTYFSQLGAIGSDLPLYYKLRDYSGRSGRNITESIIRPWINGAQGRGATDWLVDYQDASRVATDGEMSLPLTVLSLTLPGVPLLYYGQELGFVDGQDGGVDPAANYNYSRDPFRSPMQWNNWTEAGFTNGTAYLDISSDYLARNVETMEEDADSILNVFRALTQLRRDATAFQYGDVHFNTDGTPPEVAAFIREYDGTDRYLVIVNLSGTEVTGNYEVTFGDDFGVPGDAVVAFRTHSSSGSVGSEVSTESVTLQPYQAVILMWEFTR